MTQLPTTADVLAAGRPAPVRPVGAALTPVSARAHLRTLAAFWLAAAQGYMALVDAGCADSLHDVREALAAHRYFLPQGA